MDKRVPKSWGVEYGVDSKRNKLVASAVGLGLIAPVSVLSPSAVEAVDTAKQAPSISASSESLVASSITKKSKKKKLSCKKLNKKRAHTTLLKPKEKNFLKKNCGIKYPNIIGSTKKTKKHNGIYYNWGPKPIDTGYVVGADGKKYFPDEMRIGMVATYQFLFDDTGSFKGWYKTSANPYHWSLFPDNWKSVQVSQDQPVKTKPGQIIDATTNYQACNESDEVRSVTMGLKTTEPNPTNIAIGSSSINPGECKNFLISDSIDLPITPEERDVNDGIYLSPNDFVHIEPNSKEDSYRFRGLKTATMFFTVNYDDTNPRQYERGILIGQAPKESILAKPGANGVPVYNRGW